MGGKSSKRSYSSRNSSYGSTSNVSAYPQSPYHQPAYTPPYASPSPFPSYSQPAPTVKRKLERKYSKIDDDYNSLEQVTSTNDYNPFM